MIWVDVAASQRGGVVTSTSKGLEKSSQGHVGNDGRCFFFFEAFLIGRCFLWHFNWAVSQKKGGLSGGGERGGGVFSFSFFWRWKIKILQIGNVVTTLGTRHHLGNKSLNLQLGICNNIGNVTSFREL